LNVTFKPSSGINVTLMPNGARDVGPAAGARLV
jgi:hypothetical protein